MKFKNYLKEAKQIGILYHYTKISGLFSILKSNKLKVGLSPSYLTRDKVSYVVSMTRDKNFHKINRDFIGGVEVRLVLDGDRLSNKYKIKPYQAFLFKGESEEVIFEDIDNISKYIKEIDIIIPNDSWNDWKNDKRL